MGMNIPTAKNPTQALWNMYTSMFGVHAILRADAINRMMEVQQVGFRPILKETKIAIIKVYD